MTSLLRDPRFGSQYPGGGSQLSVTIVPGDPAPSSDLFIRQACTRHTDIHQTKHPFTEDKILLNLKKCFCILIYMNVWTVCMSGTLGDYKRVSDLLELEL